MKFIPRRHGSEKVEELKAVPLFHNLPRRQLELVAANLDEVEVPAGETLIREGHHNNAFWIIREGLVEMAVGDRKTHEFGPGAFFGATSMLDGRPAVATVRTKTPLNAWVASAEQFRALEGNETIALRLMSYALERLREDLEAREQSAAKDRIT
jgi:CRP-like cAMP-binding protein